MRLPLHSYRRASATVGGTRLLNCFAEAAPPEGKQPTTLLRAPGIVEKTSIPHGMGRGIFNWNGTLYAVVGQTLYSINAAHGASALGTVKGTSRCSFGTNSTQLVICAPPFAYVLEAGTLTRITDADFLIPAQVASVDGYAVFREADSGRIFCSDLDDALSYDALFYATAEGLGDDLNGIIADHRQLILTGAQSTELWENTGGAGFPFSRAINGFLELGCANGDTLAKLDNTVYMLASDLTVRRLEGLTWVKVSHPGVEQAIRTYDRSGAYGYAYTQDGHLFYCITFPAAEATWVFDAVTREWHERESNGARWRPIDSTHCYGRPYIQRYDTGAIGYLDPDVYTDCGERMTVQWTYAPVYKGNKPIYHGTLECVLETGIGMDSDSTGGYIVGYFSGGFGSTGASDTEPQILLSASNDGGREWHALPTRGLGKLGERYARPRWHGLGRSRERVYRMTVTDPVKVVVTDTILEAV